MNLNVGCGTHYARNWTNVDRVYLPEHNTTPDVVANPIDGLPFADNSAQRLYLGHILEHIRWDDVLIFATEMLRVLAPGGKCVVVGPDILLTIDLWRDGALPLSGVTDVMENASRFQNGGEGWDGARHQWNCYEERARDLMEHVGFVEVESWTGRLRQLRDRGWPIIAADARYQFGFICRKP